MVFYIQILFVLVSAEIGLAVADGSFSGTWHSSLEFLFRVWVMPLGWDAMSLLSIRVLIGFGAYLLSQAYRMAQPAVVAPFENTALPLSFFLGFMTFGDWPEATAMAGMD